MSVSSVADIDAKTLTIMLWNFEQLNEWCKDLDETKRRQYIKNYDVSIAQKFTPNVDI